MNRQSSSAAWLVGTRRLPGETIAYLGTVGGASTPVPPIATIAPPRTLFIVRRAAPTERSYVPEGEEQSSLFAVRKVSP